MPLYHLHISDGHHVYSDASMNCSTCDAAWAELTQTCGDLIRDVTRTLGPSGEWQIELLDQTQKPLGRIRLVAERVG
jgi:hypothetical protein